MGQAAPEEVIVEYLEKKAVIIDCRTPREFSHGHIKGALNIPHNQVERHKELPKDKNQHIIVYCRSGNRSGSCEKRAHEMGYKNIINGGGFMEFKEIFDKV